VDKLTHTQAIAFLLILVGGLLGILYWGILAWRNPIKFKEMSFFNSNEKLSGVYLWFYRIFAIVFGIAILFSIFVVILDLVSIAK